MLAEDLGFPFVELSREIEKFAGCSISEIQALYGQNAYRRYERRALEEAIQIYPEAVIATPGGIVSDLATFNLLLAHCTTVWLQAEPEDHMKRVVAQGDMRPMAASREAMADLKSILAGRAAFYSKAELRVDTSAQPLDVTFQELAARRPHRARPAGLNTHQSASNDLTFAATVHYDANQALCTLLPDQENAVTAPPPVDYRTDPARYRHWKLTFEGPVATLAADFDENAGMRPGYKLKLNSYDLGVDIELNDAVQPHPLRAPRGAHGGRHERARTRCSARAPTSSCSASPATPGR